MTTQDNNSSGARGNLRGGSCHPPATPDGSVADNLCSYQTIFSNKQCENPATHELILTRDGQSSGQRFCWEHCKSVAENLRLIVPVKKRLAIVARRIKPEKENKT